MALTPVTREEYYLAKAGGQDVPTPSPVPRKEKYLAKLSGQDIVVPTPKSRREKFLYAASGGDIELPSEDKMRRIEKFMAKAGGRDVTPPTAVTREEQFWGAVVAESGIKTLTGRLPLFFQTSERKLRDWTIHGNNDVGKNLLEIPVEGTTYNGVSFIVDKAAGTVTATRVSASSSDATFTIEIPDELKGQNLYFSGCPSGGSVDTYNVYALDYDTAARVPQWDGTTPSVTDYGTSNNEVRFIEGNRSQIRLRIKAEYNAQNIVFRPMLRKSNTSADFEPYQIGVGERTKNLIRVPSIAPVTDNGVTFTFDPVAGTVTANGTATGGNGQYAIYFNLSETINTYLSGCPAGGSESSYFMSPWDTTERARPKKWDGVTPQTGNNYGDGDLEVQFLAGHRVNVTIRIKQGYTANNLVFKPMLRKADTSAAFEPYGYVLNIGVGVAPISSFPVTTVIKRKTINLGESPLVEGQTLSMSDLGDIETIPNTDLFIAAFEGFHYDSQLSYNQPEMKIKYKESEYE